MTSTINYKLCVQIRVKPEAELPAAHISPTPGSADSNLTHDTILAILLPTTQEKFEPVHMLAAEIVQEKNKDKLEAAGPAFLPLSEAAYRALTQQIRLADERIRLGSLGDEKAIVDKIEQILTFAEVVGPPELLDLPR